MPFYGRDIYHQLIRRYVRGDISAGEFERTYLSTFKADESGRPENEFPILDRLFADVDAYCEDATIRDDDDLDERQLHLRAQVALAALDAL